MREKVIVLTIILIVGFCSCTSHSKSDQERYGNSFINLNDSDFSAPKNWQEFCLIDSSFMVLIPPYMVQSFKIGYDSLRGNEALFIHNDSLTNNEYKYGQLYFMHRKLPGNSANAATDYIFFDSGTLRKLDELVDYAIGKTTNDRNLQSKNPPDIILNGPFHQCLNIGHYGDKDAYAIDIAYRRGGHSRGKGPVSCHYFIIQNCDEVVHIQISHHDRDSLYFKDLFKVVKTFKWKLLKKRQID